MLRTAFSLHTWASLRVAALLCALVLAILALTGAAPAGAAAAPAVDCAAVAVMDQLTGRFVYVWHADRRLPMASTTKIMTAKAVLDSDVDLDTVVRIGDLDLRWDESSAGLEEGQRLSVDQLLGALLVASANDAARVLAVAVDGSEQAFVVRMNRVARTLGLSNTHFVNPHGMDVAGHYTSARDLTRLALAALRDERFAAYVRRTDVLLPGANGKGSVRVQTTDTFMLANPSWVYGVKTGYTDGAGSCLVSAGVYRGERIIVTVLGAADPQARDRIVGAMYSYGRSLYRPWSSPTAGTVIARIRVPYARRRLGMTLDQRFAVDLPPGAKVRSTVAAPASVTLPVGAGQKLGTITYTVDGRTRGSGSLLAEHAIPTPDWRTRLRYGVSAAWSDRSRSDGLLERAWHKAGDFFEEIGDWVGALL